MYIIRNASIYKISGSIETEIQSPFALEKIEAEKKQWEKQSWKIANNDPEDGNRLFSRSSLWGSKQSPNLAGKPAFKFCFEIGARLYYVMALSSSHGLFYYDNQNEKEIRLFHREEFCPRGFFLDKDLNIITTQSNRDGSVNLVKINQEGKKVQEITDGDCIDEHPWVHEDLLYYQTSGLARNPEGHLLLRSSSSISCLSLKSGELTDVKEDPKIDYLLPKTDKDGNLFYIQRPYLQPGQAEGFLPILKDVLLFPYRLIVAIFGFLNTFSLIFGKKPLMSAGGPEHPEMDLSHQIIHGQYVNTLETIKKEGRQVAVSRDWKLIKRHPDGKEEVIATNVVWFDVSKEKQVIYTDGFRIYDFSGKELYKSEQIITFVHLSN